MSAYDAYFRFIQATPIYDEKGNSVGDKLEEEIEVFMSPEHAKALLKILDMNIKQFEERFGEINVTLPTIGE